MTFFNIERMVREGKRPEWLQPALRPGGVVLGLQGNGKCTHWIHVRVEMFSHTGDGRDGEAIRMARRAGERYALLDRMCPLCRKRRKFRLPLLGSYALPGTSEAALPSLFNNISYSSMSYPHLQLSDPLIRSEKPPHIAVRWFREAKEHRQKGEWAEAEKKLRDCIALCDELHMIGERLIAEATLKGLLEEAARARSQGNAEGK